MYVCACARVCARRTRDWNKNKNSRLTHNDACTHVHTRRCASMLILLLGAGYHGHLSLGGLIIRELFRYKALFLFLLLIWLWLSYYRAIFTVCRTHWRRFSFESWGNIRGAVHHIFCTCVANVSVLQVATLEILIRISLSHRRSYSFTQLDQITVPVVLPAFPSPRSSSWL